MAETGLSTQVKRRDPVTGYIEFRDYYIHKEKKEQRAMELSQKDK